ncbi:MAG: hypothetical protein IKD46_10125 [Lentisphaeria bacterium]|nr:hypothetical protein [Lentisphaeria bacterium]
MAEANTAKTYKCGTLEYTKLGLIALFGWLLWGDFCYTIMEAVVPSLVPLKLKSLNCPNWVMGMILTTVPNVLTMTIAPYISVKSDRCRSRWGRRIPFIFATLPFLCINLLMLGWGEEIAHFLRDVIPMLQSWAPATVAIAAIGIFMIMFQFFNLFVNSVFNCLFNDVVPPDHLGKFAGLFRVVGTAAGALYNWFAFQYAATHMQEIFLIATILYLVGIGAMCIMVKEGEYPPVEETGVKKLGGIYNVKTYFTESFSHPFYWFTFVSAGVLAMAGASWGFTTFFYLEKNMSLVQIGHYHAIYGLVSVLAVLFAAGFVDKWHPLRVYAYISIFTIIGTGMNWIWIFIDVPGVYFYWLSLGSSFLYAFMCALSAASSLPMLMRLYPHSRYGQFCSAQGIIRSVCAIAAGVLFGMYLDIIRNFFPGNFCYRFNFTWSTTCCLINVIVCVWGYRVWNKMGGDKKFNPPAPWDPKGYEEVAQVPTTGLYPNFLKLGLYIFDALMILSLLIPIGMLAVFRIYHMPGAADYFLKIVIPLSAGVLALWLFIAGGIRRDIGRAMRNEPMHNGLPHHGLMIVISLKFAVAVLLWAVQLLVAIEMKNDFYALIFGLGNIVTNILICIDTWVLARIERDVTPEIQNHYTLPARHKWYFAAGVVVTLALLAGLGWYSYHFFIGDADTNRLRNAQTMEELQAAMKDGISPEVTAAARLRLARLYAEKGDFKNANAQFALLPDVKAWPAVSARYDVEQAFIFSKTGKPAEARKLFEKVAEIDNKDDLLPIRVEAACEAGRVALEMKDPDNARIWLNKAVKLQSLVTLYDSKWSQKAKELLETLPKNAK